ncbi:conserved hypothetical protein [Ricinus communis]|uniref:Uncharacterized protein n=1 Tax=Ricinus communis TaxID=3988 RepID=B9SFW0_RICCO|nr:conserved hypothetical protein [Ricinus communis]
MEIFSNAFSAGSIKRYRKRRRYQRLIKQKNTSVPAAAAWGWNMRAVKLKLRTKNIRVPPVKIMMTRLRNAYVRMMACFAGHLAQLNTERDHTSQQVCQYLYSNTILTLEEKDGR